MHRWLLDTHTYTLYKPIIRTLFPVKCYRFCEQIHVTVVVVMFLPRWLSYWNGLCGVTRASVLTASYRCIVSWSNNGTHNAVRPPANCHQLLSLPTLPSRSKLRYVFLHCPICTRTLSVFTLSLVNSQRDLVVTYSNFYQYLIVTNFVTS